MPFPKPLDVVAIEAHSSVSFVRAVFAAYANGTPLIVASSREAAAALPGLSVSGFVETGTETGWFDEAHAPMVAETVAQVSFTSGTTGTPKGILLTHAALADTVARLNAAMALDETVREYVGVPATYSFGLGRFRAVVAVGGKTYIPPHGFDPMEIARMLRSGDINALSAVPTLLRLLIAHPAAIGDAGHRLRWLEIGSQYMSAEEKIAVRSLFPAARIIQHYGLTEASRTTFLDISRTDGPALASVGRPSGAVETAIADDGRIRIRGNHVARHWINSDGLHSLTDAENWLVTNDLGRIEDGYLHFEGRADDLINCGGVKIAPDTLEERLRGALGIADGIAVARVPDAERGDGILIAAEARLGLPIEGVGAEATAILAGMGLAPGNALHVVAVAALPVTATGKVRRGRLAEDVIAQGLLTSRGDPAFGDGANTLDAEIARLLGAGDVANASFVELGGDSLNYVRISMVIEERLGFLPDRWEEMPIRDLAAIPAARTSRLVAVETGIVVRAIAILLVVLDHAWRFHLPGAAVALMMVAGQNYVRFQMPKALRGQTGGLLANLGWRIVLPYFTIVTLLLFYHHRTFWPQYLLFSNMTTGVFNDAGNRILVPYWFIENYILYVVALTLLFASGFGRRVTRAAPWSVSMTLYLGGLACALVAPLLADWPPFYPNAPLATASIFLLGALVQASDSRRRRVIVSVVAATGFLAMLVPLFIAHGALTRIDGWVLGAEVLVAGLLLWTRRIALPGPVSRVVSVTASASLYIYIVHPFVLHFISQDGPLTNAIPAVVASTLCGILVWQAVEWTGRVLGPIGKRLTRLRFG